MCCCESCSLHSIRKKGISQGGRFCSGGCFVFDLRIVLRCWLEAILGDDAVGCLAAIRRTQRCQRLDCWLLLKHGDVGVCVLYVFQVCFLQLVMATFRHSITCLIDKHCRPRLAPCTPPSASTHVYFLTSISSHQQRLLSSTASSLSASITLQTSPKCTPP